MNENAGVSVIICCYNSSQRIGVTLEHLQRIRTSDIAWEVILVDNNSDDDTSEKAQRLWNENPVCNLKIVNENKRGLMNARIKGVETSAYNILSFIDDDNWIEPLWIEKVNSIMRSDNLIAACGGSSEGVFEVKPPDWFNEYSNSFAVGHQQNTSGYVKKEKGYLWGAGLTVRKKAWFDLFNSGFKSMLKGRTGKSLTAGEDSELCLGWLLRGWKLWYDDSLTLKHYIPASRMRISYLIKMYEGFGKAEVVLSIFRTYVQNGKSGEPSWMAQGMSSIKNMCRSGIKSLFSSGKNDQIKYKILWRHDRAFAFELLSGKKKYEQVKRLINETLITPVNTEIKKTNG